MDLRDQIISRITNYKTTLAGISDGDVTEWHKKQYRALEDRIEELEWTLKIIEPAVKPSIFTLVGSVVTEPEIIKFLEERSQFQKDENGIYIYFSDNEKHIVNLTALLEDFKQHITDKK